MTAADHRANIYSQVEKERDCQDAKWGQQTYDSFRQDPFETCCETHGLPEADDAKARTDLRMKTNSLAWADIFIEEYAEAAEEFQQGDLKAHRKELIQCVAVLVAHIEDLDRKNPDLHR